MENEITQEKLLIPVYINEKIVLDMLAIMEDSLIKKECHKYDEEWRMIAHSKML